ncbi:MAG: sulfatase [Bacteroidales bacterium]|nr:sulfatase [Bacteroidales bacterium]
MALLALAALPVSCQTNQAQESMPNILFIAVDDLKPILGCYGNTLIRTPNIDRIAARGTVFMSNYCQQAVSGPTRASLMTGMRPDYTGVWDLKTRMRDVNPDILTLPQYLSRYGYTTQGIGKVYDSRCVDENIDGVSWTVPYYRNSDEYYPPETGKPQGQYQNPQTKTNALKFRAEGQSKGLRGSELNDYVTANVRPTVECEEVPDNAYNDGANARHARDILISLAQDENPFFFAVGFAKPHLPFVAPKKYWDMYSREEMPLAQFTDQAKNSPEIAYHHAGEIYNYTDIPSIASFSNSMVGLDLPEEKQRELIHGYHAAVSYTDANIGILLNTLDSLGLTDNTIIVLWGDHGWHLGDHNLWCKHTNFEQAARAPLLISAPWIKPSVTSSPTEFVDIFPTLCDLAGLDIPEHLDGESLVRLMKKPGSSVKEFAVSQYPRTRSKAESERLGYSGGEFMGYSIRTARYRYTLWLKDNFRSSMPFSEDLFFASELYDYVTDPLETVNVADEQEYEKVAGELHEEIVQFFARQAIKHKNQKLPY